MLNGSVREFVSNSMGKHFLRLGGVVASHDAVTVLAFMPRKWPARIQLALLNLAPKMNGKWLLIESLPFFVNARFFRKIKPLLFLFNPHTGSILQLGKVSND